MSAPHLPDGPALALPPLNEVLITQQLRRQIDELAEADRKKDEFLAMIGHELRNPLASLVAALHFLRDRGDDGSLRGRALDLAERQVHQLAHLVNDLLDLSRVVQGKVRLRKEAIDLAAVVARAVETALPMIERRGHELEVEGPLEPVGMEADPRG